MSDSEQPKEIFSDRTYLMAILNAIVALGSQLTGKTMNVPLYSESENKQYRFTGYENVSVRWEDLNQLIPEAE